VAFGPFCSGMDRSQRHHPFRRGDRRHLCPLPRGLRNQPSRVDPRGTEILAGSNR
jgi:hypothetical protein